MITNLKKEMETVGRQALEASRELTVLSSRKKNAILESMADALEAHRQKIRDANTLDVVAARKSGLSSAMIDRLELTDNRISGMVKGIRDIVGLKDPVGQKISRWMRPNGLDILKVRVPIGVIAIIYESRPNVTADAATLCFKASNAVILRGGSESFHSNLAITRALQEGGAAKGMPRHAIQLVETTDRKAIRELVQLDQFIDVVIPRGGEGLIRAVTEMSLVPVLKHYKGVCHLYVDKSANLEMAATVVENAKCQRPGVCNAIEKLLVHEKIAAEFLPKICDLLEKRGVELRGDATSTTLCSNIKPATEGDWYEEYLDLIITIGVVRDVEAAVQHINKYGSRHSDGIIAEDKDAQETFTRDVDSSTVYVNASTRFTDGGEFGMGAEIGISTDKLHARGPMGLEELTTYKYVVRGNGQIRS